LPGLSVGKASQLLQQMDRQLKAVPEVARVFGKMGRAETATDPAPLEMVETTVQFKPHEQWRKGLTMEELIEEMDRRLQIPGLANVWVPPIRNRIDMLATGIKTPVGVKIAGADPTVIDRVAQAVEQAVRGVPGVTSALAERLTGGRYIEVDIDRDAAGRYGMNIEDVQSVIAAAIGGETIGETVEGLQRFPISVRYPRELRDSVSDLRSRAVRRCCAARMRDCPDGSMWTCAGATCAPRLRRCRRRWPAASVCRQAILYPGPGSSSIWSARRRSSGSSCRSRCW
jgi:Cu(I)/Ag(I) efflux system membrane protein CusA/SilA